MKRERFPTASVQASLGLTIKGAKSDSWTRTPDVIKVFQYNELSYHLGIDLESPECERIIGQLEQEGRVPQCSFDLYIDEQWWQAPDQMWVAADFRTDHWVDVSPTNLFDPVCPPPCYGLVPPHLPLHVLNQPRGLVVGLKNDLIFSDQLAGFLKAWAPCDFGEVYLNNRPLRNYGRFLPQRAATVLVTDLMKMVPCAACGCPILASRGHLVGHRIDDLLVCRNEKGIGHMAAEHPVLVSIDVAVEVKRRFGKTIRLDPILDVKSRLGQRIVELTRRLELLETTLLGPRVARAPDRE